MKNPIANLIQMVRLAAAARLHRMVDLADPTRRQPQFAGQHTNPEKNARRSAIKAAGGFRQFKKQRAIRRAAAL